MDKEESLTPISIAFFTVLFAIISIAVYLTKGKSKFWLSNKMRIGALLLTVSSIVPVSCCYAAPSPSNRFYLSDRYAYEIDINLNIDNKISGIIEDREGTNFSFNITDTLYTTKDTLQIENISASDGAFDDYEEEFTINVDQSIKTGTYRLNLYTKNKNEQNQAREIFTLNIINED